MYTGWSKKVIPPFQFCDNFRKCTSILTIITVKTRNGRRMKIKLPVPPQLYYVTTLPRKNNTAANTNAIFDLLMLVVHHQ